jgi:hypothetical protein
LSETSEAFKKKEAATTSQPPSCLYSAECVEGGFCGVLRSSQRLAPPPNSKGSPFELEKKGAFE